MPLRGKQDVEVPVVLAKLDVTRHLKGSFYAPVNSKLKHKELALKLEEKFNIPFVDNGNSLSTCFQFECYP